MRDRLVGYQPSAEKGKEAEPNKEAYNKTSTKESCWRSALSANTLFKEFGPPDAVRYNADAQEIVVTYHDRGEKSFKPALFLKNGVYAERCTGRIERLQDEIGVEVAFDGIPDVLVQAKVIFSYIPGVPKRDAYFGSLTPEMQHQVLALARERAVSPAEVAEERLQYGLTKDYETAPKWKNFTTSLEQVQYPGELFFTTRRETVTVEYGESLDGYRPAGSRREWVDMQYLVVGARSVEPYPGREKEYAGGKEFLISETSRYEEPLFAADAPPERAREYLIDTFREQQHRLLNSLKKEADAFAPNDIEIHGMSREEWLERYNQSWDAAQKKLLEKMESQQAENIARKKIEWDTYSTAVESVKKYRAERDALYNLASTCGVTLQTGLDTTLHRSKLGIDPLDVLNHELNALTVWLPAARQELNRVIASRGEVLFATSAEREKALAEKASPARWFLHNISEDRIKEYGRAPGEGFGLKDAVTGKYLPGKRAVIGVSFDTSGRSTERYTYVHVSPLEQLPETNSYRHDTEIVGLAEEADWRILGITTYDDEPFQYRLINERGNAEYLPQEDGGFTFRSKNWDGIDGAGPTVDELLVAHKLKKSERKNWSVQRADGRSAPPIEPPVSPMSGVFGSKFAKALAKETPSPSVAEVAPRADTSRRAMPEKALSPEQLAALYDECKVKRSYLQALITGMPNYKAWHEKKTDMLTLLSVTEHNAPTFSSRTEYDKIMGKLGEVERQCSKLLKSEEYKNNTQKINNPNWTKDLQEIWKSIPGQIVTEVGELISVAHQAAVRDAVYARASEIVEQLQQARQPNIKKMIDDAAEQYL